MSRYHGNKPEQIKNFSPDELAHRLTEWGLERFRFTQLMGWLYDKNVTEWENMTNLGKSLRSELAQIFQLGVLEPSDEQVSVDGARKFLFELDDMEKVESVFIPDGKRRTLCISTQVGCSMGCKFCRTATLGFKRNLETWEVMEQLLAVRRSLPRDEAPTNVVFMGMGEPLLNYENVARAVRLMTADKGVNLSRRHVTISTVGIPDKIRMLGVEKVPASPAISLNAPDDETRSAIMPVNRKYPLRDLFKALRKYPLLRRRRITFEYVMLEGINDSESQARNLVKLLKGIPSKVNLIPFNPFPGCDYQPTSMTDIERFQALLRGQGVSAFIRLSRGSDIMAACGQLAAKNDFHSVSAT